MYRAGIQSNDRQRGEGNEEYILFQIFQILQNLDKDDVLCHQNVMEGLNILIAVLDGNAIAKADCLDFLLFEPVCTLLADKESLINFRKSSAEVLLHPASCHRDDTGIQRVYPGVS